MQLDDKRRFRIVHRNYLSQLSYHHCIMIERERKRKRHTKQEAKDERRFRTGKGTGMILDRENGANEDEVILIKERANEKCNKRDAFSRFLSLSFSLAENSPAINRKPVKEFPQKGRRR